MTAPLTTQDTEKLLKSLTLPPLPSVMAELRAALSAGGSMADAAKIIGHDLGLAAAVLKVANSPAFAGRTLSSLDEALLVLGMANLDAIVTSVALRHTIPLPPIVRAFWDEQARMAGIARHIAQTYKIAKPEQAYLFSLFRDVGIPVLVQRFSSYVAVLARAMADPVNFVDIELKGRSTSHTIVGYLLARTWFMPDDFALAIYHHHDLDRLDSGDIPVSACHLIAIGQLAEHVLRANLQCEPDPLWTTAKGPILAQLGLHDEQLDELREVSLHKGF
jgi:HD-like signal output (HDOD) protein